MNRRNRRETPRARRRWQAYRDAPRVKGAYTVLAAEPKYPTVDLDPETVEAIAAASCEVYRPEHRELFRLILFAFEAEMGERSFSFRNQLTLGGAT